MPVTIYHNPACGTSRNVLGADPQQRRRAARHRVSEDAAQPRRTGRTDRPHGHSAARPAREKGTPYHELGLDNPALTDEALIDAMMAHPILINRPIVVTDRAA